MHGHCRRGRRADKRSSLLRGGLRGDGTQNALVLSGSGRRAPDVRQLPETRDAGLSSHLTTLRAMRAARLQEGLPPGGLASATTRRQRLPSSGRRSDIPPIPAGSCDLNDNRVSQFAHAPSKIRTTDRRPGEMRPLDSRGCGGTLFRNTIGSGGVAARPTLGRSLASVRPATGGHRAVMTELLDALSAGERCLDLLSARPLEKRSVRQHEGLADVREGDARPW